MIKKTKLYTAADFAKYYEGKMSFAEMHALEEAALSDPFLADSLEGYALTENAENDLVLIKGRLSVYEKKSKHIPLLSGMKGFMRIAAILIVMLGIGYYFYPSGNVEEEKMADTHTTIPDTLQLSDNNFENAPPKAEQQVEKESNFPTLSDNNKETNNKDVTKGFKENDILPEKAPSPLLKKPNAAEKDERNKVAYQPQEQANLNQSKYYMQQGNVTDMLGDPLQGVTIKDKSNNTNTVTDDNGRFTLKTTDSNAYVSVGNIGYESKEVKLNNSILQNVKLNKKNNNLDEVVVSSLGQSRKRAELGSASATVVSNGLEGKVAGVNIKTQQSSPIISKEDAVYNSKVLDSISINDHVFAQYLINNKIPLFDENNNPLKGKVNLSFFVNKNGYPENIKIIKSTCEGCNKEAIELLKKGPIWINNILQNKSVFIEF